MTLDELVEELTRLNKEGYDKLEVLRGGKTMDMPIEKIRIVEDMNYEPAWIVLE